ncbi:hypothetical protein K438DRAFT_1749477 [Mycena galopus ATCC 62051]|nr:hypothetical protein K438DRAFT_1749477 [Mycena galopus ATCC 62051]
MAALGTGEDGVAAIAAADGGVAAVGATKGGGRRRRRQLKEGTQSALARDGTQGPAVLQRGCGQKKAPAEAAPNTESRRYSQVRRHQEQRERSGGSGRKEPAVANFVTAAPLIDGTFQECSVLPQFFGASVRGGPLRCAGMGKYGRGRHHFGHGDMAWQAQGRSWAGAGDTAEPERETQLRARATRLSGTGDKATRLRVWRHD